MSLVKALCKEKGKKHEHHQKKRKSSLSNYLLLTPISDQFAPSLSNQGPILISLNNKKQCLSAHAVQYPLELADRHCNTFFAS